MSNTPGSSAVNVENTQKKILKSIDDLKKMEEELYKQLQTSGANENDVQKQQELIGRIENVSAIRKDLLNSLTDRYIDIQDNVISSRNDLVQLTAMVGIVQDELDKANANIDAISSERNNKMRMVELNTYERERNELLTQLGEDEGANKHDVVSEMRREIFDLDKEQDDDNEEFYDNEANDISHLDEDYQDGVYYEEDREGG